MLLPRFKVFHYNRRTGVKTDVSSEVIDCDFNTNMIDSNQTYHANTGKIRINNPEIINENGSRSYKYPDAPKMFDVEDRVLIFVWQSIETVSTGSDYPALDIREPTNIDDKFGFDGLVSEVKYNVDQNSRIWTLSLNDTSQVLLRNFVPCAYQQKDEYNNSPGIIRDIIRFVNNIHQVSTEGQIRWSIENDVPYMREDGTCTLGGTGSYKTMKDISKSWDIDQWVDHHIVDSSGDLWGILSNSSNTITLKNPLAEPTAGDYYIVDYRNFKPVNLFGDYKPACQFVQALSSLEYVNDPDNPASIKNPFYFYIKPVISGDDVINYFVWKQMSKDATEEMITQLSEGVDFESYDATHGAFDAINAMIINAGHSPTGHSIHTYKMDIASIGKIEGKWKYKNTKDGDIIMSEEKKNNYASFNQDADDNFPIDAAFTTSGTLGTGYQTYFRAQVQDTSQAPEFILDENVLIANRTEYIRAVRKQAKGKAKLEANKEMKATGNPRWKMNVQLIYGTTKVKIGQILNIMCRSLNWVWEDDVVTYKKLRVKKVKHQINRNGWETGLELEEDYESITQIEGILGV